jgi:hypothetical protein
LANRRFVDILIFWYIIAVAIVGEQCVIQRKTQTAEYWQAFTLTSTDVEFLRNLMLEADSPRTTRALAIALIGERCRREESELHAELTKGTLYQPKKRYAIGEKVLFPALDFRLGQVTEIRGGHSPEYGDFEVITVDFGPDRRQRSFAANLAAPHKLNVDVPGLLAAGDLASPEKLLATVTGHLPAALHPQLSANRDFATFEDRWLLRDVLADIHVGHLNIAEALIEMRNEPVKTDALLKELDLPAEIGREVLAFSLQSAMAADGRFDQVGAGEIRRWFLRRLEPIEALQIPPALFYQPLVYDRDTLTVELMQLEWELDDEWTEHGYAVPPPKVALSSTTILLTYPHLISGTLPLTGRGRAIFPTGYGERTMVTLIDGRWGQRFPGWVVPGGRYIAGLRAWFDQHKLPAGAFIVLERRNGGSEILVDFKPKRMRREWARVAQVVDGARLEFQMRKLAIACEYDEDVIIGDERMEELVKLRANPVYAEAPLAQLVYQIFTNLAGLSQQGSVHAKTLYSAINVIRRCPPGPIFTVLATDSRLESIGNGYYRLVV